MDSKKVIDIAESNLGYTEYPKNSNLTKYGESYGLNGRPWCVIFLWWCFKEAGLSSLFFGGAKTASCGTLLRWYKEQSQLVPKTKVRPGDIVILNFHGTQDTEHCGLVTYVNTDHTYIRTIEGNTTPGEEGSQDNGGSVAQKVRYPRQIIAVIRPQYKEETMEKLDYVGHWSEDFMKWAIDKGFINGYEDGTFRPDKEVTRAELIAILKRYDDYRFGGSSR